MIVKFLLHQLCTSRNFYKNIIYLRAKYIPGCSRPQSTITVDYQQFIDHFLNKQIEEFTYLYISYTNVLSKCLVKASWESWIWGKWHYNITEALQYLHDIPSQTTKPSHWDRRANNKTTAEEPRKQQGIKGEWFSVWKEKWESTMKSLINGRLY